MISCIFDNEKIIRSNFSSSILFSSRKCFETSVIINRNCTFLGFLIKVDIPRRVHTTTKVCKHALANSDLRVGTSQQQLANVLAHGEEYYPSLFAVMDIQHMSSNMVLVHKCLCLSITHRLHLHACSIIREFLVLIRYCL